MPGGDWEIQVLRVPALLPEPWVIRKLKVPASSPGVLGPVLVQEAGKLVQVILPFAPGYFSEPVVQTGYGAPSLLSGVQ